MMGEQDPPALRTCLQGFGLGLILQPIKERFKFGNSSESKVTHQVVIPIGIEGHVGDLGNITADDSGISQFTIEAKRVDLLGDRSIVGRGLVVHADEDDLGRGGDAESLKTGNAGDRLAWGIISLRSAE